MACFHPQLVQVLGVNAVTGKNIVNYLGRKYQKDGSLSLGNQLPDVQTVPCQKCIGCQLSRSREWAVRCMHENYYHNKSSFLTLTYSPEHLPINGSVNSKCMSDFFKRLRKKKKFSTGEYVYYVDTGEKIKKMSKIKFLYCGEYGEKGYRPHYHVILFGVDFSDDRYLYSDNKGIKLYRSDTLEELWPFGFSTIGEVTEDSCAYVARYVMKKQYSEVTSEQYYSDGRRMEFISCSNGIGRQWIEEYADEVYALHKDYVPFKDYKIKPPRYYDKLYDNVMPESYDIIKERRLRKVIDFTATSLKNQEEIQKSRIRGLERKFENGKS